LKKNVLLGICVGYNAEQVKYWILSAKKYQEDYDIVLVNVDRNLSVGDICNKHGVKCAVTDIEATASDIYHKRHLIWYEFLEFSKYEFVLCTDVIDVVFQANPFAWIDKNMGRHTLIMGGEGVLMKEQQWNVENIKATFPAEQAVVADKEILCGGMFGGYRKDIMSFMLDIYNLSVGHKNHNVIDQAAMNVVHATRTNVREQTKITNTSDSFICHLFVSGAAALRGEYPTYQHDLPVMSNGVISNQIGKPYAIVHQYNRFPEWQQELYRVIDNY